MMQNIDCCFEFIRLKTDKKKAKHAHDLNICLNISHERNSSPVIGMYVRFSFFVFR